MSRIVTKISHSEEENGPIKEYFLMSDNKLVAIEDSSKDKMRIIFSTNPYFLILASLKGLVLSSFIQFSLMFVFPSYSESSLPSPIGFLLGVICFIVFYNNKTNFENPTYDLPIDSQNISKANYEDFKNFLILIVSLYEKEKIIKDIDRELDSVDYGDLMDTLKNGEENHPEQISKMRQVFAEASSKLVNDKEKHIRECEAIRGFLKDQNTILNGIDLEESLS